MIWLHVQAVHSLEETALTSWLFFRMSSCRSDAKSLQAHGQHRAQTNSCSQDYHIVFVIHSPANRPTSGRDGIGGWEHRRPGRPSTTWSYWWWPHSDSLPDASRTISAGLSLRSMPCRTTHGCQQTRRSTNRPPRERSCRWRDRNPHPLAEAGLWAHVYQEVKEHGKIILLASAWQLSAAVHLKHQSRRTTCKASSDRSVSRSDSPWRRNTASMTSESSWCWLTHAGWIQLPPAKHHVGRLHGCVGRASPNWLLPLIGIDTICFFFQHIMLFIMLFFCSNYAKKYAFCPSLC